MNLPAYVYYSSEEGVRTCAKCKHFDSVSRLSVRKRHAFVQNPNFGESRDFTRIRRTAERKPSSSFKLDFKPPENVSGVENGVWKTASLG